MFGGTTGVMSHSPRIPQMKMMKVHIPFTFKLHESFRSTYAGKFFFYKNSNFFFKYLKFLWFILFIIKNTRAKILYVIFSFHIRIAKYYNILSREMRGDWPIRSFFSLSLFLSSRISQVILTVYKRETYVWMGELPLYILLCILQ